MQPAPDLISLFNFEDQIEQATRDVLSAADVTPYLARESSHLPETYVGLMVEIGGALDHYGDTGAAWEYDIYDAALTIEVVTTRDGPGVNAEVMSLHSELRARLRVALMESRKPFCALPWLEVVTLRPTASSHGLDENRQADVTMLRWALRFGIRPGAWPVDASHSS